MRSPTLVDRFTIYRGAGRCFSRVDLLRARSLQSFHEAHVLPAQQTLSPLVSDLGGRSTTVHIFLARPWARFASRDLLVYYASAIAYIIYTLTVRGGLV